MLDKIVENDTYVLNLSNGIDKLRENILFTIFRILIVI